MSVEEHATLSLGLAHCHSLRIMVSVVRYVLSTGSHELGRSPFWPSLSRPYCTDAGRCPSPSVSAISKTYELLAVAIYPPS